MTGDISNIDHDGYISKVRGIIKNTRDGFERNTDWVTTRRLKRPEGQPLMERNSGYLEELPVFEGKTFVQFIEEKVAQNGKATLLDIGCGAGLALLDLRKMFPQEKLRIVALGHKDDLKEHLSDIGRNVWSESTEQTLKENAIEFYHLNLVDAQKFLSQDTFDIITAVKSLYAIDYPKYSLVKKIWRFLKQDGVAFLSDFSFFIGHQDGKVESGPNYLRREFRLPFYSGNDGISFKKTQPNLPENLSVSIRDFDKVIITPEKTQ